MTTPKSLVERTLDALAVCLLNGACAPDGPSGSVGGGWRGVLTAAFEEVRAEEREAAAKRCDEMAEHKRKVAEAWRQEDGAKRSGCLTHDDLINQADGAASASAALAILARHEDRIAAAIRARGKPTPAACGEPCGFECCARGYPPQHNCRLPKGHAGMHECAIIAGASESLTPKEHAAIDDFIDATGSGSGSGAPTVEAGSEHGGGPTGDLLAEPDPSVSGILRVRVSGSFDEAARYRAVLEKIAQDDVEGGCQWCGCNVTHHDPTCPTAIARDALAPQTETKPTGEI